MKNVDCIIIEKDDLNSEGRSLWEFENYKDIRYHHLKSDPAKVVIKSDLVFIQRKHGSIQTMKNRFNLIVI